MAERRSATRRDDTLARFIIEVIASNNNGENLDFNWLQKRLSYSRRSELLEFLQNYPDIFAVSHERGRSEIVSLIVPVKLCPDYCSETNCIDRDCPMFHICKFYILSNGCLSKKNTCKYGHGLHNNPHNSKLLRAMLLDQLPIGHVQKLFRLPRNRTEASIPRICSFYNVKAGCSKREKCTSLHICEHYVWRNCKFGRSQCNRSHDLLDNEKVLKRFGINTERYQSAILEEIKEMYDTVDVKRAENDSDEEEPRNYRNARLDQYTPRSEMPDMFSNMFISPQVDDRQGRSAFKPIQQPRPMPPSRGQPVRPSHQPIHPSNQPIQPSYRPDLHPALRTPEYYSVQNGTRPKQRQRYNSAPSGTRSTNQRITRSRSQHPENRKLYSQARRFGSSTNISSPSREPVICQYYMKGYCRYKNHCKNIHPPKDDSSDNESEGYNNRSYSSDEYGGLLTSSELF